MFKSLHTTFFISTGEKVKFYMYFCVQIPSPCTFFVYHAVFTSVFKKSILI